VGRILLTGSSGFLGGIIHRSLGDRICTLSRGPADIRCDLTQPFHGLTEKFDFVVHAAGKAHSIPKNESEEREFFRVNVKGTEHLLAALEEGGLPKSFIYISSVAVYGRVSGQLLTEKTPLEGQDPYGLSKIQAEERVRAWSEKRGVDCVILRLPLVAGPNPPGNLKNMISGIRRGYYFNIGGGKAKKSMVLAEDIAGLIPSLAGKSGVFNLSDGYHPSFGEIARLIADQLHKRKPANIPFCFAVMLALGGSVFGSKLPLNLRTLKKMTSDLTFDDSKARKHLGWDPNAVLKQFRIS
jgi:nucleoside-diphosphate-sugar epimerase